MAVLALATLAAPEFRVGGGVAPGSAGEAARAWTEIESLAAAEGLPARGAPRLVGIASAPSLPPGVAGASRPGAIALRPGLAEAAAAPALRHEVAHQVLFHACPGASGDRLFHEAFALAASGELEAWTPAPGHEYQPLALALQDLARARNLDGPAARAALARLLLDAPARPGRLPAAVAGPLSRCEAGAAWVPLRPEDLAEGGAPAADALVVLSRHSGEVLRAEGTPTLPLPFGSTLKPFVLAASPRPPPRFAPVRGRPEWSCGEGLPSRMDAATALLRSCNGWFLALGAAEPEVVSMGRWGEALVSLGLSGLPGDASEAIGLRPSLRIPAVGLAHAYRVLAESRPDLLDVLSRNAREGTLSGLRASERLAGVPVKTGTVLDAGGRPRLGWIVAVDADVVLVMARAGRTPRSFAAEAAAALEAARATANGAARVQVFGLLPAGEVTAVCEGRGFEVHRDGPRPLAGEVTLQAAARSGPALCAGGPWRVRYPGLAAPRPYAGVFTEEPAPPVPPPRTGPGPTAREARARRGSDLVFRTTRLLYAAGVVAAEDAAIRGEARIALARVADRNGRAPRHSGRPPCDTTHCQAFLGTPPPAREDRAALADPLPDGGWLPFSRGGREPWSAERSLAAVEALLGAGAKALSFDGLRVVFVLPAGAGEARWEERREVPCEALRGPLKLPSCPQRAEVESDRIRFQGLGQGHGEGLDVEWSKRSGLSAGEILARSYGEPR